MTREVWKYNLSLTNEQSVSMPDGAVVLTVQEQRGVLTFWALVNPEARRVDRSFRIVGTGHPVDLPADQAPTLTLGWHYIDTVQMGLLVWHVFEVHP